MAIILSQAWMFDIGVLCDIYQYPDSHIIVVCGDYHLHGLVTLIGLLNYQSGVKSDIVKRTQWTRPDGADACLSIGPYVQFMTEHLNATPRFQITGGLLTPRMLCVLIIVIVALLFILFFAQQIGAAIGWLPGSVGADTYSGRYVT